MEEKRGEGGEEKRRVVERGEKEVRVVIATSCGVLQSPSPQVEGTDAQNTKIL